MAYKDFQAGWVDVYNDSGGWHKEHSDHPMQYGGTYSRHTWVRIPEAVRDALESSRTTATGLEMRMYVTNYSSEIDIGEHSQDNDRAVGATGMPYYSYNETWRPSSGTGWRVYGMSNYFKDAFLNNNVTGLVMYNTGGEYGDAKGRGVSSYVRFRVTGEWEPDAEPTAPEPNYTSRYIGDSLRVYLNPNKDGLSHSVKYELGNETIYLGTSVTASYVDWTLPTSLAESITNSTSRAGSLVVVTYEDGNTVGASTTPFTTLVPNNATFQPDINTVAIGISGTGLDKTWGLYLRGHSKIDVSYNHVAKYGASISSANVIIEGHTYNGTNIIADPFEQVGIRDIHLEVKDSRGFTEKLTYTKTSTDYTAPTINDFVVRRSSGDGITFYRNLAWSDLGSKNTLTVTHRSKTISETGMTDFDTGTLTISPLDKQDPYSGYLETQSYEFEIYVEDELGNHSNSTTSIGTAQVPISWSEIGVGAGKVWERGALDVGGDSYFSGNLEFMGLVDTQTNTKPFMISRLGDKGESVSIGVNDTTTRFDVENDEEVASVTFGLTATDTEASTGVNANSGEVQFTSSTAGVKGYIDGAEILTENNGSAINFGTSINMSNNDGFYYNDSSNIMYVVKDGTNYAVYDEHHKPDPAEIGAVPRSGGNVDGPLNMNNADGSNNTLKIAGTHFISNNVGDMTMYNNRADGGFQVRSHSNQTGYRTDFRVNELGFASFGLTPSGYRLYLDDSVSGSQGGEPTMHCAGNGWGSIGTDAYAFYRMYAYGFINKSTIDVKENLSVFDDNEAMDLIQAMPVYSYKHTDKEDLQVGILAEEAPYEILNVDKYSGTNSSIDIYSLSALNTSAIRGIIQENEDLKERLAILETKIV